MAEKPAESPQRKWIEPVVAVLMALTTLCTAWCSYESAAWTAAFGVALFVFAVVRMLLMPAA
jgi:hypothetical protein